MIKSRHLLAVPLLALAAVAPLYLQQADAAPPATASNPDDPKFAAHFSGRVIGPDGQPVNRARLYVAPLSDGLDGQPSSKTEPGAGPVRFRTDADGRFAFDASDMTLTDLDGLPTRRRCVLIAAADGYGLDWIELRGRTRSSTIQDAVRGTDRELHLAMDDVPIRGQFLDADARPLAGARVRLTNLLVPKGRDLDAHLEREKKRHPLGCSTSYERWFYTTHLLPEATVETRTDADGRFTMTGLGRDRIARLTVTAPSVVDASVAVMTRAAPDTPVRLGANNELDAALPPQIIRGANFALMLDEGGTISGVVRDRGTRQPIPGMWVGTGRENFPRDGIWNHQTVTDAEGRFTITGLPPDVAKWGITAVSPPGMTYQCAGAVAEGDVPLELECRRGIPFRLKVVDEAGQPVEAEVVYRDVLPNPHSPKVYCFPCYASISHTVRQADGTYQGFVLPGPGALFVKTPTMPDYRPAQVDPKAFFAPGRTIWTGDDFSGAYRTEAANSYGTKDHVATTRGLLDQNEYAAILLVNPATNSPALQLTATIVKDKPRTVSLVDRDGQPIAGVRTQGMTSYLYDHEPPLRAATFPLLKLHPDRFRRITFTKEDRQLIGFLLARGDDDAPYTVRMQPWGTVTGRLLDSDGKPFKAVLSMDNLPEEMLADHKVGERTSVETDAEGRFRVDQLVPGLRYSARIHLDMGKLAGVAFENLMIGPGEVRDLGDVQTAPSVVAMAEIKRRH